MPPPSWLNGWLSRQLPEIPTFTPPGGGPSIRGTARAGADVHRLELRLDATRYVDGVYSVLFEGYMRVDGITLAVPIDGALTVAH